MQKVKDWIHGKTTKISIIISILAAVAAYGAGEINFVTLLGIIAVGVTGWRLRAGVQKAEDAAKSAPPTKPTP